MNPHTIDIAIADDHAVVRAGYKRYIELEQDVRVVAEANSAEQACALLLEHSVDVLLMDLSMPGMGGLEGIRRIRMRNADQKIIVFSMHDNPSMVSQALAAGACGYMSKSAPPEHIVQAIRDVMNGARAVSPDLARNLSKCRTIGHPHLELAPREFDIFLMLADGHSVEQVAERMHLSVKTVANYQSNIRQKMSIHNAVDLYKYAQRHGLL